MSARRAIALALALALPAATGAQALTPAPACFVDPETQRMLSDEEAASGPGEAVYPYGVANQFVVSVFENAGGAMTFLHHCPTDAYLVMLAPSGRADEMLARFDVLMDSPREVTMQQIAEDLADYGAFSRLGQGDMGRCDCDTVYGR